MQFFYPFRGSGVSSRFSLNPRINEQSCLGVDSPSARQSWKEDRCIGRNRRRVSRERTVLRGFSRASSSYASALGLMFIRPVSLETMRCARLFHPEIVKHEKLARLQRGQRKRLRPGRIAVRRWKNSVSFLSSFSIPSRFFLRAHSIRNNLTSQDSFVWHLQFPNYFIFICGNYRTREIEREFDEPAGEFERASPGQS